MKEGYMHSIKYLFYCYFLLLLTGCAITITTTGTTTGEIKGNTFYLKNNFSVDLLDDDWEVVRQRGGYPVDEISFLHKKSNGRIRVNFVELNEIEQKRPLDVIADAIVADKGVLKLSQKMIKIDGIDAIEFVLSGGNYMHKYILLKKDKSAYEIQYTNTATYFDEYLGVFDKFVSSFKILK